MTMREFILGILGSIIATAIYKYGEGVFAHVRSNPFPVWLWAKREITALRQPIAIVHAVMPILIISFLLAVVPKSLAPTEEPMIILQDSDFERNSLRIFLYATTDKRFGEKPDPQVP